MSEWKLQFDPEHKIMDYFDQCNIKEDQNKRIQELINKYTNKPEYECLEVGVGCAKYGDNWKVLDPYDKRELIDYRITLENARYRKDLQGRFDFIKACAIFEHVQDPFKCAEGVVKMLKVGGIFYGDFPFVFPYHPYKGFAEGKEQIKEFKDDEEHGGDYWRYTPDSVKLIFRGLKTISLEKTNAGSFIYIGVKE